MDKYQQQILPEYLAWFINNSKEIKIFHKQKATTTIPSISISQLSDLEIAVPSLSKQKLVVDIQQLRDRESDAVRKLESLKDQLTQQTLLKAIKK